MDNLQAFDQINKLNNKISVERYFDGMELSDGEKARRKQFSYLFRDAMLYIFALYAAMKSSDYLDKDYLVSQLEEQYYAIAIRYTPLDPQILDYITEFSEEATQTTIDNDADYYTSDNRAVFIAVNEANTTLNYDQYKRAVSSGMTKKEWVSERDAKVRRTHRAVDRMVVPINDYFVVGRSKMRYPKDISLGAKAEEIINCRCAVRYLP